MKAHGKIIISRTIRKCLALIIVIALTHLPVSVSFAQYVSDVLNKYAQAKPQAEGNFAEFGIYKPDHAKGDLPNNLGNESSKYTGLPADGDVLVTNSQYEKLRSWIFGGEGSLISKWGREDCSESWGNRGNDCSNCGDCKNTGVDFSSDKAYTDIYPVVDGVITDIDKKRGKIALYNLEFDVSFIYLNVSNILVTNGQQVSTANPIGGIEAKNRDKSTLHFEAVNGMQTDMACCFSDTVNPFQTASEIRPALFTAVNDKDKDAKIEIQSHDQDIVITNVSASKDSISPGESFILSHTVQNQGTSKIMNSYYEELWLSSNSTLDLLDTRLGRSPVHIKNLEQGQTISVSGALSLSRPGTWFLIIKGDAGNNVPESNEDNNTAFIEITVNVSGGGGGGSGGDIVITDVFASKTTVFLGKPFTLNYQVKNQGVETITRGYFERIWMSPDATLSNLDSMIGTTPIHLTNLAPDETRNVSGAITLRSIGTWFIFIKGDAGNNVPESNENNNTEFIEIKVERGNDITPEGDIVITNVSASETFVSIGEAFTMSHTVKNQGKQTVTRSYYEAFRLSSDSTLSIDDTKLGSTPMHRDDLPPGGTLNVSGRLRLNEIGTWFIFIKGDAGNNVFESNERNNTESIKIIVH